MDNQLMLIIGGIKISWFAVFTAAACLAGMMAACLLRRLQRRPVSDIFIAVTFAVPLGLLFGRILYSLFPGDSFSNLAEFADLTNGGFGLYGVLFGVFLAAVIACRCFRAEGPGSLLDCLAVGGSLAIAAGRFATCFTSAETGYQVDFRLFTVYDSRLDIYNLAVYQLDGIYESVIFVICAAFFIYCLGNAGNGRSDGKPALLMIALHGTNQVVMDSMRADPLKLGLNEFIKISQIIGILCCVAVLVYLIVDHVRRNGFGKKHVITIAAILISIVLGVVGEYRVGSSNYISNHVIMLLGMLILDGLVIAYTLKSLSGKQPAAAEAFSEDTPAAAAMETEVSQPELSSEKAQQPSGQYGQSPVFSDIDYEALKNELDEIN